MEKAFELCATPQSLIYLWPPSGHRIPGSSKKRGLHYKKLLNYKENQAVWYNLPKSIDAFGDLTCNAPVNVGFIPQSLTVIHIMNFRLNFQME